MAEIHANKPNITRKKDNIRKTILLGSASSWTQGDFTKFRGSFSEDQFDSLPDEVMHALPGKDDEDFHPSTMYHFISSLIVELKRLLRHSSRVTDEQLRDGIDSKNKIHLLKGTFDRLQSLLRHESRGTVNREKERNQEAREMKAAREVGQNTDPMAMDIEPVGFRWPNSVPVTPQRRDVSGSSFGSSHTTPTKVQKPEAAIQGLQNIFAMEVLSALFEGNLIPLKWVEGRDMRLSYKEYGLIQSVLIPGHAGLISNAAFKRMDRHSLTEWLQLQMAVWNF
jgi:hypothetical protein